MTPLRKTLSALALGAVAIAITGLPTPAKADPARWAPAYGYQVKHGHAYGYNRRYRVVQPNHHRRSFRRGRRGVIFNRGIGPRPLPYYPYAGRPVQFRLFGNLLNGAFGFSTGSHRHR